MQSTEEAVYYGIPVIGFPVLWDQMYNVQYFKKLGIGVHLHSNNISKESIEAAISEVISNKKYHCINYIFLHIQSPFY